MINRSEKCLLLSLKSKVIYLSMMFTVLAHAHVYNSVKTMFFLLPYLCWCKLYSCLWVNTSANVFSICTLKKRRLDHLTFIFQHYTILIAIPSLIIGGGCLLVAHFVGYTPLKLACTLNLMSNLLTAFAIAVVHSSRSSSFAACSKYSTFSLVVILKTPWNKTRTGDGEKET